MMKSFLAAINFLTVIPLPSRLKLEERHLEKSVKYFAVLGLIIGSLVAFADNLMLMILPVEIVSFLDVVLMIIIGGGLHLDGLADSADGFFSSRKKEQILVIMRDSRIGSMGAVAIILVIIFKYLLIKELTFPHRLSVLLLMPYSGRLAIMIMMRILTYSRKEGGLASVFQSKGQKVSLLINMLFFCVICLILLNKTALILFLILAIIAFGFILMSYLKIGGYTGDTLGAICELSELAPPLGLIIGSRFIL